MTTANFTRAAQKSVSVSNAEIKDFMSKEADKVLDCGFSFINMPKIPTVIGQFPDYLAELRTDNDGADSLVLRCKKVTQHGAVVEKHDLFIEAVKEFGQTFIELRAPAYSWRDICPIASHRGNYVEKIEWSERDKAAQLINCWLKENVHQKVFLDAKPVDKVTLSAPGPH